MTPTNTFPANAKELSDILFKEGIHHYIDEITGAKGQRKEIEIPVAGLLKRDYTKFFKALQISNNCVQQGFNVTVSEHARFVKITIED